MSVAVFVREIVDLSDAMEQVLLQFARHRKLAANDILIVAARTISAPQNYVFDLRDPADPAYLLNLVLVADTLAAPGLRLDVSGDDATAPGKAGARARTAEIYARSIQDLVVVADGGAGAPGVQGQPGVDETFTIEFDDNGKPYREYAPPTPGGPGTDAGPGGAGGMVTVVWSEGRPPQVSTMGGRNAAGGVGGSGGKGAKNLNGTPRPNAPHGPRGRDSDPGLVGTASVRQLPTSQIWDTARAHHAEALTICGGHWRDVGEYRFRQVKGRPTGAQADTIVALFDLSLSAAPADPKTTMLRRRFLDGENVIGLPRNLDVIPDFERYVGRLNTATPPLEGLFNDAKAMLMAASTVWFTQAQLDAQLNALDFSKSILEAERMDAENEVRNAEVALTAASARHEAAVNEVRNHAALLDEPIDWSGLVVVGMFTIAGFLISAYSSPEAGRIVGNLPELMHLGKITFSDSDMEAAALKAALVGGAAIADKMQGAKAVAQKATKEKPNDPPQSARIDMASWLKEAGPVIVSFTKFAADIDEARGDAASKALLKELAARLQERLAAEARLEQSRRRVHIAQMRVDAVTRQRTAYAAIHVKARDDLAIARQTAISLLEIVQGYGDIFLGYQFQAARAVEIYTAKDQSETMAMDRWHVHPDATLDFLDEIISTVAYQNRLIASARELAVLSLASTYDSFDLSGFKDDTHFVTIDDATALAAFRQSGELFFTVGVWDLAGIRWQAKVMGATVTLQGATAATPTFPLFVTHSGRSFELLRDGRIYNELLEPRSTIVQVVSNVGGMAVGIVVGPPRDKRPTDFWRRSLATEWKISIESEVIRDRQVDLANLRRIEVALSYMALTP